MHFYPFSWISRGLQVLSCGYERWVTQGNCLHTSYTLRFSWVLMFNGNEGCHCLHKSCNPHASLRFHMRLYFLICIIMWWLQFMWLFKEQRLTVPHWRHQRPYLMAQKVLFGFTIVLKMLVYLYFEYPVQSLACVNYISFKMALKVCLLV